MGTAAVLVVVGKVLAVVVGGAGAFVRGRGGLAGAAGLGGVSGGGSLWGLGRMGAMARSRLELRLIRIMYEEVLFQRGCQGRMIGSLSLVPILLPV